MPCLRCCKRFLLEEFVSGAGTEELPLGHVRFGFVGGVVKHPDVFRAADRHAGENDISFPIAFERNTAEIDFRRDSALHRS